MKKDDDDAFMNNVMIQPRTVNSGKQECCFFHINEKLQIIPAIPKGSDPWTLVLNRG